MGSKLGVIRRLIRDFAVCIWKHADSRTRFYCLQMGTFGFPMRSHLQVETGSYCLQNEIRGLSMMSHTQS